MTLKRDTLAILVFLLGAASLPVARAQDEGIWRTFLYGNQVQDLTVRGEEIWAATTGGIVRYQPDSGGLEQWNRAPQALLSDSVRVIASDASGRLWCGTERSGISVFDPSDASWRTFNSLTQSIPGDRIQRVRLFGPADSETLLVGTAQGYAAFVGGELRAVCLQGMDICGLTSYDVRDLLPVDGELWLATARGVTVQLADGSWVDRSAGLAAGSDSLTEIVRADSIYALGTRGLWTWRTDRWAPASSGLPEGFAIRSAITSGNTLWVCGAGGVYRRDGGDWTAVGSNPRWPVPGSANPAPATVTSLARTPSGRLYAGASDPGERADGIWEYAGGSWVQHRISGPSLRSHYRGLRFDADGALWTSTAQRGDAPLITTYAGGHWTFFEPNTQGHLGTWTMRIGSGAGSLWLAHCCCYTQPPENDCRMERVTDDPGGFTAWPITNAWDLDEDGHGYLWVATYADVGAGHEQNAHGLYRVSVRDSTWIQVTHDTPGAELWSDRVAAVRVSGRMVYVGYNGDGFSRWDLGADGKPLTADDLWQHYTPSDAMTPPLINANVNQIEVGPDGKVWIGTTGGISIFDGTRFTNITGGFGHLPTSWVNAMLPTDDGGAWVATENGGLTRVTPRASFGFDYTVYLPPLMPNPNIEAMTFGPDGRSLWLGTSRGLVSFFPPQGSAETTAGELGAYPNPFRPSCAAAVDGLHLVGTGGLVRGVVVDLSGRIVARFPAGGGAEDLLDPREPIWDGNVKGRPATPGLYLIRVQTPRGTKTVGVGVLDGDCP